MCVLQKGPIHDAYGVHGKTTGHVNNNRQWATRNASQSSGHVPRFSLFQFTTSIASNILCCPVVRIDAVLSLNGPLFFEDVKNTERNNIFDLFTNGPPITTTATSAPTLSVQTTTKAVGVQSTTTILGVQTTTTRSKYINSAATCGKEPDYKQCWSNDDIDRTVHACCTKMCARIRNWP